MPTLHKSLANPNIDRSSYNSDKAVHISSFHLICPFLFHSILQYEGGINIQTLSPEPDNYCSGPFLSGFLSMTAA